MNKSDLLKLGAFFVFFFAAAGAVAFVPGASGAVASGVEYVDDATAPKSLDTADVETRLFEQVNEQRADRGLDELERREALDRAAREHSRDLLEDDRVSHTGGDGSGPSERVRAEGVQCRAGENVAKTFFLQPMTDPGDLETIEHTSEGDLARGVVNGWMVSHGHRENIIREDYTQTGIGVVAENDTGATTVLVTQVFC